MNTEKRLELNMVGAIAWGILAILYAFAGGVPFETLLGFLFALSLLIFGILDEYVDVLEAAEAAEGV